ncbi:MAG: hypothetical protein KAJ19_12720 [Gammaproteobacteria bacterium]|nr:hypothetical protein [Gammaproteobacteria bacterium]
MKKNTSLDSIIPSGESKINKTSDMNIGKFYCLNGAEVEVIKTGDEYEFITDGITLSFHELNDFADMDAEERAHIKAEVAKLESK